MSDAAIRIKRVFSTVKQAILACDELDGAIVISGIAYVFAGACIAWGVTEEQAHAALAEAFRPGALIMPGAATPPTGTIH